MADKKYWYVVRVNIREVGDERDEGVLQTDYIVIQGTSFEETAAQLRSIYKEPFKGKNEFGETLTLKKCFRILGEEYKRKTDAMDFVLKLKHKK